MTRTRFPTTPPAQPTHKQTHKINKKPYAGSSNSLRRPIKPKSLLISVATTTQPVREREYTPLSDFSVSTPPFFYLFLFYLLLVVSLIFWSSFYFYKFSSYVFIYFFPPPNFNFISVRLLSSFAYFLSSAFIIFP
jgi:hypothetical protein